MKNERTARILLFLLLAAAGFIGVVGVGPAFGLTILQAQADTTLHARMPENGGWSLESMQAKVGQPLHLRLTSDDVLHSFAIGQSDRAPIDLKPGEWVETTLVFDTPGRYVYYCTRWCGRNHWRMRGTIEVTGPEQTADKAPIQPLYLRLGLDLDAPHLAEDIPAGPPLPDAGAAVVAQLAGSTPAAGSLPADTLARQTYLENAPAALFARLRAAPALKDQPDAALWNVVAYAWAKQTSPDALARAAKLYATNCAACHGETGKGDGVMVEGLPRYKAGETHTSGDGNPAGSTPDAGMSGMSSSDPGTDMRLSAPPDFTHPAQLLGASPALLEGKLLRGGMGTGMPYWGPIFTQSDLDALVAYLYTLAWK